MDLVEHIGSGLKRIRDSMKENGLEEPIIEADEHWFQMTFKRKNREKGRVEAESDSSMKTSMKTGVKPRVKTSMKILDLMKVDPAITRIQIADLLSMSVKGVDWQIARMKKSGFLKRMGSDIDGHWEVIDRP